MGRRGVGAFPKGRQVEPTALNEVRSLLADQPRDRDLLIEHLHVSQDRYGRLSDEHLAALAGEMGLSMVEVYETASFYAHFDLVAEGEADPPPLTVRVCDSVTCALFDAESLYEEVRTALGPEVRVLKAPCMGRCDQAPVVVAGRGHLTNATRESVVAAVARKEFAPVLPASALRLPGAIASGAYQVLRDLRSGRRSREDVLKAIEDSGLRGLGGAGFGAGRKWRLVREGPSPRILAVNADEGEPGTFKDRFYLETDPHRFLEGTLIAAWAIEAEDVYIYLRDEYPQIHLSLREELAQLSREGLIDPPRVHLRRGAGAYICGEETAMLESLEGKRGYPRQKPPFPTQVGLFGRPTLIHNVETLHWIRDVLQRGPDWLAGQGRRGRQGFRGFSVSGRVKRPGVKLAPAGVTARELIDEFSGGMLDGHIFKGYLPGGASGGVLPAALADLPLDFGTLEAQGCFIGSAGVVILSDQDDVRAVAENLMRFFADESCGQCTPCRLGTEKAVMLMSQNQWDEPVLTQLSTVMRDASICGLGQAAANPLLCALRYFPDDLR
ncbi:MAG: NAD(P)H-dependent oxidoreductase subunit E [Isosphaeraceae bacterium]